MLNPLKNTFVSILSFFLPFITHLQNSLASLESYIKSQKAILAFTLSDVDPLRLLREQAATDSVRFFMLYTERFFRLFSAHSVHLHEPQLHDNVFHFDHQPDIAVEVQDKID